MQRSRRSRVGVSLQFTRLCGRRDVDRRIVWGAAVLLALCALSVLALNAADALAHESDTNWDAHYWNNTTLTGIAVLAREDETLDFDWGEDSPGADIPADNFSARWHRHISITAAEAGTYIFTIEIDDGVRLWVDEELLIDSWIEQAKTSYEATMPLSEGQHLVRVEYFELTGTASISVSWAREPDLPTTYWQGEYFNNSSLEGTPQLTRGDARISFDWGEDSPADGLNQDGFSVRWRRNLQLPAGDYRFTVTVDDGVRLFIGDRILIDAWGDQPSTAYAQNIYLDGEPVTVRMEYYEGTGEAEAHLSWLSLDITPTATPTSDGTAAPTSTPATTQTAAVTPTAVITPIATATPTPTATPSTPTPLPTPTPTIVWQAQYWNNLTLTGDPALTRQESAINYVWGDGSPTAEINADSFSARWTGRLSLESGSYRFDVVSDDGVRLFLNGVKRIEAWSDHAATAYYYTLQHDGGDVNIVLEYYEHLEAAQIQFAWVDTASYTPTPTPTLQPTAIPTPTATPTPDPNAVVIVDDQYTSFQRGGLATTWREETEGYADHLYWTNNNDKTRSGYNWGKWSPQLDASSYEVFVYIPQNHATTGNARYWISHTGGFTLREVDQSQYSGQWVSLGTYIFSGTDEDSISLSDVTYETYLSHKVAWDAIKWEKR